jgi:Na+/H+-translocating membrane pyrophosphatase
MNMLNRGYWVTTLLSVVGLLITTNVMMNTGSAVGANGIPAWIWFFLAGVVGLATSVAFVYITQYYTAGSWRPVKEIAEASRTGPATNIISGVAVGFETTAVTAITIGVALFASHWLGQQAHLVNTAGHDVGGIFGTAVATMGMLMTTAYILAMDTFGPITDNAGGIAQFSRSEESAREITDRLDAVGNTTKALTKGYAIASASLAAFLLSSSRRSSARCWSTSSARSPSARSAPPRRRSSSRSGASSARCRASWITPSDPTTPASSTSPPAPPCARWSCPAWSRWRRRSPSASCSATRPSPVC